MSWYVRRSDKVFGPFEDSKLKALAQAERIQEQTELSQSRRGPWVPASQVEGLFAVAAPVGSHDEVDAAVSPPPLPWETEAGGGRIPALRSRAALTLLGDRGGQALRAIDIDERRKQARQTIGLYKLFWTRVLKSDFSVIHASVEEAGQLEAAAQPVTSTLAQNYASWRRSLLMISLLAVGISLLFNVLDIWLVLVSEQRHLIMKLQSFSLFFFQLGAAVLCLMAARDWVNLQRSRSWARLSWLTQFVGPFLIFLIPLSIFVNDTAVLAQLGVGAVLTLAPKIFGLFPGLIRCSLTVKTLLPETAVAGWLVVIIAPLYALVLLVAAIVAVQTSAIILGVGLALIAAGMSVVLMHWERLLKPADQVQASGAVRRIKYLQKLFQVAGIACVGLFLFKNVEMQLSWFNKLFLFTFSFVGNVTLLTVVMSDLLLAMIFKEHQHATAFLGTEMAQSLSARLDDLSACGLTDLQAGEAELASGLRTRGGALAMEAAAKGGQFLRTMRQRPVDESVEPPDPPELLGGR